MTGLFGGPWSCPGCGTWYPPSKRVDVETPSTSVTLCRSCVADYRIQEAA